MLEHDLTPHVQSTVKAHPEQYVNRSIEPVSSFVQT